MLAKAPINVQEALLRKDGIRFGPFIFTTQQRKCPKTKPFCIKAGYTRKPTGTPGAYQLINDETGEKFIVWGGSDDAGDSPIPSKQALAWKPETSKLGQKKNGRVSEALDNTGFEPTVSTANYGETTAGTSIFASSFGRLKAQHVRALMNKTSKVEKGTAYNVREFDSEDMLSDQSDSSDLEVDFFATKTNVGSLGYKANMASEDIVQNNKMIPDASKSKHIWKDQPSSTKSHGGDPVITKSNVGSSLRGWSNASSYQKDKLNLVYPSKQPTKTSADSGFFSRKSFKDLGCSEDMIESLRAQLFHHPSHIQAMAYVPVSEGKSCIIADQSGSGKTLAYLAPVIQRLRQEELQGLSKSSSRSPRVVILVPTAELASQVLNNCRSISRFGVPFRSMVATGGFRQKTQLDNLQQDIDVLIATPGRFMFLLQEGLVQLTNLICVVLDEVDILFGDEGFEQALQSLINCAPVTTQYLFVTATLPVDIYNKLVEVFPDCEVIMGPGMHRTSSGLEEILVNCSGNDREEKTPDTAFLNKKSALLQLVEEKPVLKTIIFCNKIETCRKVENVLKRFDRKGLHIGVLPFHAALEQESRLANMKEFLSSQSKDCLFLICTDRASRGIDFANVDHVVLFDFPRDPSEYVRRVGRTARGAGGKGKAFVFVVGKQVSLARRIIERNQKGHPLHDVPAAYELVTSAL